MDLPDRPRRTWQDIRQKFLFNNTIEMVQQNEVPPIPHDLDAHTDVLAGIRVHHRSCADTDDIAVWEPQNTNIYIITRYEIVNQLIESKDEIPEALSKVLLLAGGAVVGKVLLEILQNFIDNHTESTSNTQSTTQRRPSPGNRQYNLFISHAWDYNDEYERVVDFLNEFEELKWQNHSVPLDDPLSTVNDVHLLSQLRDQIQTTAAVLVLAGMYSAHREWIQNEIEIANEMDKPIVGIRPHGSEQTPNVVEDAAVEMVGWRQNSIVGAIVEHTE